MSEPSRRYLFTMWEGGGTVPPELGVARRLVDHGHRVHVVADPTIRERAEAVGCSFSPWRRAPHRASLDPGDDVLRDWEAANPIQMLRRVRDRFVAGPAAAFAADTADAIDEVGPDAVVADAMMLGTIVAAQGAGLPVAALVPNIWMIPTPGVPVVGPGLGPARTVAGRTRDALVRRMVDRLFDGGLPALNAARAEHGLEPLRSLWRQVLDVDRIFVLSSSAFDFASVAVPSNTTYVGPILDDPPWAGSWEPPWSDHDDRPLVLVGFSSTFQDQVPQLSRVVDALAALPVRAVVTLGQMLERTAVGSTGNVAVVPAAPHSPILAEASLAVTHCGHGTTLKALAAGVPLVCMPMGRDQHDTAARVVHHGAGVRIPARSGVERIRRAVRTVLGSEDHAHRAQRLAAAIAAEQRAIDVVGELAALAGHGPRPVG